MSSDYVTINSQGYLWKGGSFMLLSTVVDDTLDLASAPELRATVHALLEAKFGWKSSGSCTWYLGCRINQNYSGVTIDQSDYLASVVEKYFGYGIRKTNTPMNRCLPATNPDETSTDFPYGALLGSLIWMTKTRPDISFAVSQCSRHLHCHTKVHDEAVLRILGYLLKFPSLGLFFPRLRSTKPPKLSVPLFADTSWADIPEDRSMR